MNLKRGGRYRLGGVAIALSLGLTVVTVVHAQEAPISAGIVLGEVDRCNSGTETPVGGVNVGIDGGSGNLAKTDQGGQFVLNLAAGTYTVVATADDGSTVSRPYVPVEGGEAIDIGIMDLGGGLGGCGTDASVTGPALPTFTPTAIVTVEPTSAPAPATATPVPPAPTPTVEATAVPDDTGDTGE
jgi:hypothetical protein